MIKNSVLFTIITLSIFLCGCETIKTGYIDADKYKTIQSSDTEDVVVHITGIFFKNGNYLDVKDRDAKIINSEGSDYLVYDFKDSQKLIKLDRISTLKIEIVKSNKGIGIIFVCGFVLCIIIYFAHSLHNIH